jgi:uncharacterized protein (TIGR02246 family)
MNVMTLRTDYGNECPGCRVDLLAQIGGKSSAMIVVMLRWLLLFLGTPLLFAQADGGQADEIRTIIKDSEAAWNRGDLVAFTSAYEDSAETTFIGREVTHGGTQAILERYRRTYPNREAMGNLTFSEVVVRILAPNVALATGKYDLKRTAAVGGDAGGRFTLILRKTSAGWKITHDHTS